MGREADVVAEWAVAVPSPPAASARIAQTYARATLRVRHPIHITRVRQAECCQKATWALLSGVVGGEPAMRKVCGMVPMPPRCETLPVAKTLTHVVCLHLIVTR